MKIGINPWFTPHNSYLLIYKPIPFKRPGQAFIFTANAGIVQLCKTSLDIINTLIWDSTGKTNRLKVSNNLKSNFFRLNNLSSTQIASKLTSLLFKVKYSYDQYHCLLKTLSIKSGIWPGLPAY